MVREGQVVALAIRAVRAVTRGVHWSIRPSWLDEASRLRGRIEQINLVRIGPAEHPVLVRGFRFGYTSHHFHSCTVRLVVRQFWITRIRSRCRMTREESSMRRVRVVRLVAACALTVAPGMGCGQSADRQAEPPPVSRKSASVETAASGTVSLRQWSRQEAIDALGQKATVSVRATRSGYLVEAIQGGLAVAPEESAREATLRAFLAEYGVLLRDPKESVPLQPITLKPSGPPILFHNDQAAGVFIAFTQHVDAFAVYRGLVGGRFVGNVLDKVSGRFFDPVSSPARGKSLACTSPLDARARFVSQPEFASAIEQWAPSPYVDYRTGKTFWLSGLKRLDAVTCEWLPDLKPLVNDPNIPVAEENKP